ncbi:MAG: AAA family ATPase [Nitrososphaerota archaeon]|nr:AAA family ATPase [Nitrososphaerota archaeon]
MSFDEWVRAPVTNKIVRNRVVLTDEYAPEKAMFRDDQIKQILFELRGLAEEANYPSPGKHLFVTGYPGGGKTFIVKKALGLLKQRADFLKVPLETSYVNCSLFSTQYRIYRKMLEDFGVPVKDGWQEGKLIEQFGGIKSNKVIVIDEVDQFLRHQDERLLYALSRTKGTSVVLISNKLNIDEWVKNPAVLSSLAAGHISFKPYNANQLRAILTERAKVALTSVPTGAIALCAGIAAETNGDARFAMKLLLQAADMAEMEGARTVTEELMRSANEYLHRQELINDIKGLPYQALSAFKAIVKSYPETRWSVISGVYKRDTEQPLTDRRAIDLLRNLDKAGLISVDARRRRGTSVDLLVSVSLAQQVLDQVE